MEEIGSEHFEFMGGMGSARINSPAQQQRMEPARASVSGNFANPRLRPMSRPAMPSSIPADFKAAAPDEILPGCTVLHLKFGEGKILGVEGPKDNKVATIQFKGDEVSERRIVLKFAKLQVVG